MINEKILKNLINLNVYEMSFDETDKTIEGLEYKDSNNNMRKIKENGMSETDIKFFLLTEQTCYLKSIKNMIKFFVILTIINILCWFYIIFIEFPNLF